jgi:hypothetical protein
MCPQILVLGTTDEEKTNFITLLINNSESSTVASSTETDSETSSDYGDSFIDGPSLDEICIQRKNAKKKSSIDQGSNNCWNAWIKLILFITHKGALNSRFAKDFRFVISTIFKDKVPAICVVNGCENANDIYPWILKNKAFFDGSKVCFEVVLALRSEDGRSKSIQKILEAIDEYLLLQTITSTCSDVKDKNTKCEQLQTPVTTPLSNSNTIARSKEKPVLTAGENSIFTIFSRVSIENLSEIFFVYHNLSATYCISIKFCWSNNLSLLLSAFAYIKL